MTQEVANRKTAVSLTYKPTTKLKVMTHQPTIGTEVVRSKGDYVVGRTGIIIALDAEKNRAQVEWQHTKSGHWIGQKSWVKIEVIEPTAIPYEILDPKPTCPRTGRMFNPTYRRLA